MCENNSRRCVFTVRQTAELAVKGQKALLYHNASMRLIVVLWVLCVLLIAVTCGMSIAFDLPLNPPQIVLLVMLPLLIGYRLWWVYSTIQRAARRFHESNPDGPFDATYWVEGDRLYLSDGKNEQSVLLSIFKRMLFHKDLVLLKTNEKLVLVLERNALPEEDWRELCTLIQAKNPKFRHPFK